MNLLLDTHIALWALNDNSQLSASARTLIRDAGNALIVSVASLWEISIKHPLGRKEAMPVSGATALDLFERAQFRILPVTAAHAIAVEELPPVHGDPFDRLIVAQALSEPMRLVTADRLLARYSDTVIVV
jgi:PIN domain nuclease of toxin-antitoxin system